MFKNMSEEVSNFVLQMATDGFVPLDYMFVSKGSPSLASLFSPDDYIYYTDRRPVIRRIIARELIGMGYSLPEAQQVLGLRQSDQPRQPGVEMTRQDFLEGEWTPSDFITLYEIVEKLKLRFPDPA